MRSFDCHYYKMRDDGVLIKNTNNACWAGLNGDYRQWGIPDERGIVKDYDSAKNIKFNIDNKDYIFIDEFKEKDQSTKNINRIILLINKIVPCSKVRINGKVYIKYKLLENHYSNLLLLNFIRMLWYKTHDKVFNHDQFFIDIFQNIRNKEPLIFLMTCLRNNVINQVDDYRWYGDYSAVYKNIIPKPKERLYEFKSTQMSTFLQSE